MAFEIADVRTAVNAKLQDDGGFLTDPEKDECINQALRDLNKDVPRRIVIDIAGDNSKDYGLPTASFVKGFTHIRSVEVPADEDPPQFRRRSTDWFEYENPTKTPALRLRFKLTTPATGEIIRIVMTTPYVILVSSTLDNETVFGALIAKSLQLGFTALAARFNQTVDPTIAADAVDYQGRPAAFLVLSDTWRSEYRRLVGLAEQIKPAMAISEADIRFQSGEDFLWHEAHTR